MQLAIMSERRQLILIRVVRVTCGTQRGFFYSFFRSLSAEREVCAGSLTPEHSDLHSASGNSERCSSFETILIVVRLACLLSQVLFTRTVFDILLWDILQ
jgi:hypothetical protein